MSGEGLRSKAKSGVLWGGGYRLAHNLLQFSLTLVLARLLTPADFGTYAVVAGIIGFLNAASFDCFLGYLLQVRDEKQVHLQDHFTAAVALQSAIFLIANVVALVLRQTAHYAAVAGYIHFLSPIILLSSVGGFRFRMLERSLDWRRLKVLQGMGMIGTVLTVIGLALAGAGVTALLVGQSIKYFPAIFDLLFVERWRPTWEFSWQRYRPAFRFGLNRIGSEAVLKGRTMLEANWLVFLTSLQTLGYLNRAVGLAQLLSLQFTTLIGQATYPVLARIEPGTPRFREAGWLMLHGTAWVIIPLATLLGLLSDVVVRALYGDRWAESAALLPWVLIAITITGLAQTASVLLLSSRQQGKCVAYDVLRLMGAVVVLALWPLHNNLTEYLASQAVMESLLILVLYTWLVQAQATTVRMLLSALIPPILASSLAGTASQAAVPVAADAPLYSLTVVGTVFVYCLTYLAVLRVLFPHALSQLVAVAPLRRQLSRLMMLSPRMAN